MFPRNTVVILSSRVNYYMSLLKIGMGWSLLHFSLVEENDYILFFLFILVYLSFFLIQYSVINSSYCVIPWSFRPHSSYSCKFVSFNQLFTNSFTSNPRQLLFYSLWVWLIFFWFHLEMISCSISLSVWFISLSIMSSGLIHVVKNTKNSFFLMAE